MNNNKLTTLWEEAQFDATRIGLEPHLSFAQKIIDGCCTALCKECGLDVKPTRWASGNWMHLDGGGGQAFHRCPASDIYEKFYGTGR